MAAKHSTAEPLRLPTRLLLHLARWEGKLRARGDHSSEDILIDACIVDRSATFYQHLRIICACNNGRLTWNEKGVLRSERSLNPQRQRSFCDAYIVDRSATFYRRLQIIIGRLTCNDKGVLRSERSLNQQRQNSFCDDSIVNRSATFNPQAEAGQQQTI